MRVVKRQRLCDTCYNRERVVESEIGLVHDMCGKFCVRLVDNYRHVTECSSYSNKGAPPIFAKTAWVLRTNEKGKLEFQRPVKKEFDS